MSLFVEGEKYSEVDYIGGRDHWGHFFLDFFPQRILSNSLYGSGRPCLVQPLERFENEITTSAKYLDPSFNPIAIQKPNKSTFIELESCRLTSMSYPLVGCSEVYNRIKDTKPSKKRDKNQPNICSSK